MLVMESRTRWTAVAVLVLGLSTFARAQATTQPAAQSAPSEGAAPSETTKPAKPPAAYPKDTKIFSLLGGYQNERTGEDIWLASVTAAWGRYFYDNAAIEVQAVGYGASDESECAGFGVNALARYHFVNIGRYSLYGDVLGGVFWLSDDFPTGGTELNFTYAGGPGLSVKLRDRLYLDGGLRFQHVSNGFIEGRDRNPIFNSFGGYVGLMWTH